MAKDDIPGVWALHVWRSPDGNEHPQWSGPGDPRSCRCGERHTLADATSRLICPGVAHYEGVRPCVLCGLGWRMPEFVAIDVPPLPGCEVVRAAILDDGPRVTLMESGVPRPPLCAYCMVLEGKPLELARHRVQAHHKEDH
jgi:hypothetical protein